MKKKIFAIGALVIVMSVLLSTSVFAQYKTYDFAVYPQNNYGFYINPEGNPKNDAEHTAYVHAEYGNLISDDLFYFSVFSRPVEGYCCSYLHPANSSNHMRYAIDYLYDVTVHKNDVMYLAADTDRHEVSVNGYWYS